jgi:hypothetical protein
MDLVLDNFSVIPTAGVVYDLYTAPNAPGDPAAVPPVPQNIKSAVIESIRLVNKSAGLVTVNLDFMRPHPIYGWHRRVPISRVDQALQSGFVYIDDSEITLEPGDRIQGVASVANAVHYVISGVEREVV